MTYGKRSSITVADSSDQAISVATNCVDLYNTNSGATIATIDFADGVGGVGA
jgi:hypothetical protein